MGTFDYNSFDNLSQMFACRRGFARERVLPLVQVQAETQKVVLYALSGQRLSTSKFANLNSFRPHIKGTFAPLAADRRVKPEAVLAVTAAPIVEETVVAAPRTVLKLKDKMDAVASAPIEVVTEEKPRSVLKLKAKIELPAAPTRLSRHSSTDDLAAAFRAELRQMKLEEQGVETKRHPLSHKSWADLLAEAQAAEAPKKPKYDIDLASAFRAEMQALTAKGTADMDMLMSAPRPRAAFEPKVVSHADVPQRRSVAKMHRVA